MDIPVPLRPNPKVNILDLGNKSSLNWIENLPRSHILKSHSLPPTVSTDLETMKYISVIRDPRDLMILSIYYLTILDEERGGGLFSKKRHLAKK